MGHNWDNESSWFGGIGGGPIKFGRRKMRVWVTLLLLLLATRVTPPPFLPRVVTVAATTDARTISTSSNNDESGGGNGSLLLSKMVADESWIQQRRTLRDKITILPRPPGSSSSRDNSNQDKNESDEKEDDDEADRHHFDIPSIHLLSSYFTNTTVHASITLGTCTFLSREDHLDDDSSSSKSNTASSSITSSSPAPPPPFEFKVSAGSGHGILCVPLLSSRWIPEFQLDLTNTPGNIEFTSSTSWMAANPGNSSSSNDNGSKTTTISSSSSTSFVRNCFGLSHEEQSIGFPFVFSEIPPQGAMVQVSCRSGAKHKEEENDRTGHKEEEPTPPEAASSSQEPSNSGLDFVIVMMDEASQQEAIIIESFLERDDPPIKNTTSKITNTSSSSSSPLRMIVRPTLLNKHSQLRGIQVQAYEATSFWAPSSSTSTSTATSENGDGPHHPQRHQLLKLPDDEHSNDNRNSKEEEEENAAAEVEPYPHQNHHHALIQVRTNKIIQRVLDGQHDNVIAILQNVPTGDNDALKDSTIPSSMDTSRNGVEDGQYEHSGGIRKRHPPENGATAKNVSHPQAKDLVVVLRYEIQTADGQVYQRSHLLSSTPPHENQKDIPSLRSSKISQEEQRPWWSSFWPWWSPNGPSSVTSTSSTLIAARDVETASGPRPLWVESTRVTQYGDVQVRLAGLVMESNPFSEDDVVDRDKTDPVPQDDDDSKEADSLTQPRLEDRRFLCTIRVGLIVDLVDEKDEEYGDHDDRTTNEKSLENFSGTINQTQLLVAPPKLSSSSTNDHKNQSRLHSLVDVAAMVTTTSPLLVIHVGWIRKGLESLQLSETHTGWDVHIEDAICQDPQEGYIVTHLLLTTTTEEALGGYEAETIKNDIHHHRRRSLFASSSASSARETHPSSHIKAMRQLLSQRPSLEERDIHDEMRMGRRPQLDGLSSSLSSQDETLTNKNNNNATFASHHRHLRKRPVPNDGGDLSHRLILVHGYCTSNTWPLTPFRGSNYEVVKFNDPNRSYNNDQFATKIRDQVCPFENNGKHILSGNIIAHSQGGAAALHMHNFYWSCLDHNPYDGRVIQAVGTPFQGTNMAGVAAYMGAVFGIGCGPVRDLSQNGALEWLQHIPEWARKRVTYYRTQYAEREGQLDFCHMLTHSLIGAPNDGVVRIDRGVLPGGIDGGIKVSQCHVPDMRDPPQVDDAVRNGYMKLIAAIPPQDPQ